MSLTIGDAAPPFNLKNANAGNGGNNVALEDAMGEAGLVVVFECNHCPYVVASVGRMNAMAQRCQADHVGFVGINSNDPVKYPNDSFEHMVKRANDGMPYPYLHDETQAVAQAYGAKRTPEFFLFTRSGELVYQGRMDDSPQDPTQVTTSELANAIDALLAGQTPGIQHTESIGCSVKWKA